MSWIHEVDALTILLGPQKMSTVNILFPCTLLEVLCFWKEFGLNETWNNWWCYTKWCTFLGPRQHPWVFKPQKTSKLRWMDVVWNSLHQKHPAGTYYFGTTDLDLGTLLVFQCLYHFWRVPFGREQSTVMIEASTPFQLQLIQLIWFVCWVVSHFSWVVSGNSHVLYHIPIGKKTSQHHDFSNLPARNYWVTTPCYSPGCYPSTILSLFTNGLFFYESLQEVSGPVLWGT